MDQFEQLIKKPSLIRLALVGYFFSIILASVVCWLLATQTGDFDNQRSFSVFFFLGAVGAFAGYESAVRGRKRLKVNEPSDEWQHFFGSGTFYLLAAAVLAGSAVISASESLIFDLIHGAPWLKGR